MNAITAAVILQAKEMLGYHEIMNGSRVFQEEKCVFQMSSILFVKKKKKRSWAHRFYF